MKMLLRSLLPLASLVIATAAPADEKTPEAILAEKGLVRDGVTLVLKDAAERDKKFQLLESRAQTVRFSLDPLQAEQQRLKQRVDEAEREARNEQDEKEVTETRYDSEGKRVEERVRRYTGDKRRAEARASSARADLSNFERLNGAKLSRLEAEFKRLSNEAAELRRQAILLYQSHAADPEVKAAIRAINRTRRPRLVLGPVASTVEYAARLRNYDLDLLREKGVIYEPGHRRFVLEAEREVWSIFLVAQRCGEKLEAAEARGKAGVKSKNTELIERRKAVADQLARDNGERKQQLTALLDLLDGQIRRLPPGAADPEADARDSAEQIEAARAAFVQAVRDLQRAADAVPEARRAAESDADVHAALVQLNGGVDRNLTKFSPIAEYQQALDYLKKVEATIQAPPTPEEPAPASARPPEGSGEASDPHEHPASRVSLLSHAFAAKALHSVPVSDSRPR